MHIIISYPDAGLGHCPEGQGPDIKISFDKDNVLLLIFSI